MQARRSDHVPFDLDRFVRAQAPVIDQVVRELTAGRKRSHWMWFVFPQLRGLGRSAIAEQYGLDGSEEAAAFLRHELLGQRLVACTKLVCAAPERSVSALFGYPDDLKFHSCVSLFSVLPQAPHCFAEALRLFFDGDPDPNTLRLLER